MLSPAGHFGQTDPGALGEAFDSPAPPAADDAELLDELLHPESGGWSSGTSAGATNEP
jgi:hypothetical protein